MNFGAFRKPYNLRLLKLFEFFPVRKRIFLSKTEYLLYVYRTSRLYTTKEVNGNGSFKSISKIES